ncbi:MAG: UpxY family transcription antiterminator, partial [Prolixibacteraceae bacterium]|nr:UpxY family transcription antiterminator [Prolixibacteraceae bacterium]
WFAIYTKANSEKKLIASLQEKNIECYLPLQKVLKYWSDRKKWIQEPLFKSYIFAKVSYKEFFTVLNTPGVVCYVSFGGKAQPIPEYQINNIKTLVQQTEEEITLSYRNIKKGQKAEVIYGSLKGVKGEIVEIHGQDRILIRIESMNCSLSAKISKDEVRIINEEEYILEKAL